METPQLVFWVLMLIIGLALVFLILRSVLKKPPYLVKMIFMTPGVDKHETVYGDSLDFNHKIGNKTYKIKAERLYRFKPKLPRKILHKFRGIKQCFIIVYQDKKTEPLAPVDVKASARIIKEVSESRALDKALKSEFSVPWDLKKILMVIGFLVIAIIVWVVISGDVSI